MKIALDVDGVISDAPKLFSAITKALKKDGHSVIIVTDIPEGLRQKRIEELQKWDIEYDTLYCTGNKRRICLENNVDFAVDDCAAHYYEEYLRLQMQVVRFDKKDAEYVDRSYYPDDDDSKPDSHGQSS